MATGEVEQKLEGHLAKVAFSPEGREMNPFSVDKLKSWVTWKGSRILYLPLDFRPTKVVIHGNTVAISLPNYEVKLMTFRVAEEFTL